MHGLRRIFDLSGQVAMPPEEVPGGERSANPYVQVR